MSHDPSKGDTSLARSLARPMVVPTVPIASRPSLGVSPRRDAGDVRAERTR